ncbi:unnamed protein product [Rotaria sp. Silwood1]|nr:unnamed protein product [Rotaria sp. Silwood1]CAF0916661.1 unnamed protein product [Rotaria sp. Silwood1]CAF0943125.1 unnamed protein product [Rotaria sp. Silwood1]CAF3374826.1 unnamed protein product [Rotaria sp. Silwood1]CAF3383133.1 unnamed protein product [Rotaria sp. Silwood1]
MLFLNGRTRHTGISPMNVRNGSYTHKLSHLSVIGGSLSIVTGLILIVVGVIYEVQSTKFIGIGLISFGVLCLLMKIIHFYGKLDICYNNWIYRTRVVPINHETSQPKPIGALSVPPRPKSPETTPKQSYVVPPEPSTRRTVISGIEIHNVLTEQSIKNDVVTNNSNTIT